MFVDGENDRELGSFPRLQHQGDGSQRPPAAQELLIEFGPLLVKKKMLEP